MSYTERLACLAGGVLLAFAAVVAFRRDDAARVGKPAPVEELAERLKEAWSEHHTRA
jgi:hypothetical protein